MKKDNRWMKQLKETRQAYLNRITEKKKQLSVLMQQQKQYKNKNEQQKMKYEEQIEALHQ